MKKVKVVGVPEHFNLPWHLAIEEGAFEQRGIDLQWVDIPEGTGKMSQMLNEKSADLAVILSEGIIKSIIDGNKSRILQQYVASPLLWGIHVAAESSIVELEQLQGKRAAISRFGSGSHLMTYLLARKHGWETSTLKFVTVNDLTGAVASLQQSESDYFMWEHFTTKPIVDQGIFRRLGDFPTPWPCFVIAANEDFFNGNSHLSQHILEVINIYTAEFKKIPSIDRTLSNRYGQELADIKNWLQKTEWSQEQMKAETIEYVIDTLYDLKLIDKKPNPSLILANQ